MAKKPNVQSFKRQQERRVETYFETQVAPYLVELLNQAQAKTKRKIMFCEGMGTHSINFDEYPTRDFNEAAMFEGNPKDRRYQLIISHFPELKTFMDVVTEVIDDLDYATGDIHPTVPPKTRTQNTQPQEIP